MFAARWRWNATRALAILRFSGGRKVPPQLIRMRADDLVAAVFPDQAACPENLTGPISIPDHVLVRETLSNCLHEAMDLDGLLEILREIENGTLRTVAIDTPEPSVLCHEILNANPYAFLDDAPLEERRTRAVALRRTTRDDVDGAGILDPAAIVQVAAESWPVVRDADELHDALTTLIVVPPVAQWAHWFEELVSQRRASVMSKGEYWTCAERLEIARAAYEAPSPAREEAVTEILRGWLESSGPMTVAEIAERLSIDDEAVTAALLRLETQGQVLRGRFTAAAQSEQWCNRRVLARIHRLTIGRLRREIEPVTASQYMAFLQRWQHVTPVTRLHGIDGTLQVVRQLEGYEIPAVAWEGQILPARIAGYKPEYLDRLCYAGDVMWGRLSPHPALELRDAAESRRVRPTRLAPIALFLRANADELIVRRQANVDALSHAAHEVFEQVERLRAPFFAEIVRAGKRLPSEVEEALWQLVAAGLVTADGFDALRSLSDAKRRLGEKGLRARPRSSSGRWTLLQATTEAIAPDAFARHLLARWGVVFRDVIARESLAPRWRELLLALRRMEARGEIRGGRFVSGFVGEQFALPEAIDALRAVRRTGASVETLPLGAYDPLNLAGIIMPAEEPNNALESTLLAGLLA
jgi:ATP-dependent Lhr-like helicase